MAVAERRVCLSALQPAARADRRTQRRAAIAAHEAIESAAPEARRDCVAGGRPVRSREALSAAALRRTGTAGRHRTGNRHRSDAAAVRRTDRRSRSQGGRRDPGPVAGSQSGTRQNHHHGHARSARGRTRDAGAAPRKRAADGSGRMKYFPLIWRNLLRRKVRTIFTLASVFIAFVLYSFLMVVQNAFSMGVEVAGVDRLVLLHKVSLIQLLPISYADRIRSTEGVTHVGHSTWFGGTYQDKATQFAVMAVDPAYFQLYPEARIPQDQMQAWLADRQGVIVGRTTATRYGWKIGDKVPIQATIWQPKQGNTWFFNIDGIYDGDRGFDTSTFFFHYEYLDENRRGAYGLVGWYVLRIDDPAHAADVAARLDAQFANSSAETKTSTEK